MLVMAVQAGGWASTSDAVEPPEYHIQRCCDLCPLTASPSSYDTGYLKNFKMLVQGEQGWLFRSEAELVEHFGPNLEGLKQLKGFARHLKETTGTELVMVFQPTKGLVHPDRLPDTSPVPFSWNVARHSYGEALERFRQAGLVVPDLTPLLTEPTGEEAYYFKRDHHWTPYGARRTAKLVADRIKKMPVYQSLPKQDFVTRRSGLIRKDGSLQDAVRRICGFEHGSQYVDEFRTESVGEGEAAGASALFGDQGLPPITLVGTSNSKGVQDYNFVGSLQEFLGVEVLNVAVAGGSYDGSMFEYLLSDNFRQSPPKILIWEVPGYHNLDSSEFYRQVTPLISGACESTKPVLQETSSIKAGVNEVLYNGGGQFIEMPSNEYVVDLQFSDPAVKEVDAFVWFVFGRKDRVDMEYGDRVETPGRFVFELPEGPDWNDELFMSLDLEVEPEQISEGLTVTAKICRRQDV